ncbi:hypothetical protein U6G28_07330 [Actinomycetaceae bacterium MB13-C1-2]|nr:hypothetical protein U6G28_07330 [Actinomycetaceae bacterium MB13-C1-2]
MSGLLTGTLPYLRSTLRQNRLALMAWSVVGVALSASAVAGFDVLVSGPEDVASIEGVLAANPAIGLILGPVGDLSTADGLSAWRNLALGGLLVGIGVILLVTKASRGQEDSGQAELFASGVLGRGARLTTACLLGGIGSVLVGLASGLAGVATGGSWKTQMLIGATFTVTGWMATGLAAVSAQLGSDRRSASTIAVATLTALYALRGFSYSLVLPEWTLWANPLGWMSEVNAGTSEERWWPLLLGIALTLFLLIVASLLQSQRDFGVGILPQRSGRARGRIRTVWGLAARLNRSTVIAWSAAFTVIGVVFGYFVTEVQDSFSDNPMIQALLGSGTVSADDLSGGVITMVLTMVGIISTVVGVQIILNLRSEELERRVDPVLGAAVSRPRLFGASVLLALSSSALGMLLSAGVVSAFVQGSDIGHSAGEVLIQMLAVIPASWIVLAVATALVGVLPRASVLAWVVIVVSVFLTLFGALFDLPEAMVALNPFHHVPSIFMADASWTGIAVLIGISLILIIVGFVGYRRRDLA